MGRRDALISKSVLLAIFDDSKDDNQSLLARILVFFSVFQLVLSRYRVDLFRELRSDVWQISEADYRESFRREDRKVRLKPVGDLGYSGSTFFTTPDSKYLIKSLPRPSEYTFFKEDLLLPYDDHMRQHPDSLLVRITDFLHSKYVAVGSILGIAPSHHIIMENVLYGKERDKLSDKWETYDLKPIDYFYPERDLAGGHLAPGSVKERLIDKFEDKIRVTEQQRRELLDILSEDTKLLESTNVVDYSLFLLRYPTESPEDGANRCIEKLSSRMSPWRVGVTSSDMKWVYRAIVLDFFWAKHKLQAMAMTGLIKSFNLVGRKGPMSITTDPKEYRTRFLSMVESIFDVPE